MGTAVLGLPGTVWAVLGVEFAERLGYYAVAFSLFTYCIVMLRTGPEVANALINIVYILIPAAAFLASGVADSRVGRPRVLAVALVVYAASLLLLCASATPLFYADFPLHPTWASKALFGLALLGFSAGYGAMKVCTNPIMADCVLLHYSGGGQLSGSAAVEVEGESGTAKPGHLSTRATDPFTGTSREHAGLMAPQTEAAVSSEATTKEWEGGAPYGSTATATAADATAATLTSNAAPASDAEAGGADLCAEPHVAAALSRLFVYAYWISNVGGLVGSFIAPLLRNLEGRRVEQGSESSTTGYYFSFLLAAVSVALGGAFLYCCFAWLPQNTPAPNFVLVRVVALALRNRWALFRGTARVTAGGDGNVVALQDWLDYACVRLERVSPAQQETYGDADGADRHSSYGAADEEESDADTATWVAECRATLQVCQAFIALPVYWLLCNQFSTNIMYQAAALNLPPRIPEELFNNVNTGTMLVFLALWDRWILPRVLHHRLPSATLRIVVGFGCMCASMLWCGFLQTAITSRGYYEAEDSYVLREGQQKLSAGWLVTPYVLQGFASACVDPTVMEVAYRDAPARMKGTVMGLYWVASSASGFLGLVLSPVMTPQNATALFFFAAAQLTVSGLFYYVNRNRR